MTAPTTTAALTMATTPAGVETPDRAARRPPRRFAQVSVRTRITAVIALLTLASMTVAGVLVYTLESARIDSSVTEQIDQEIDEFRRFERTGIDPATGANFTDAYDLVRTFLARNVPDDDEMLVAYDGVEARNITKNRYGEDFLDDPDYQAAVRRPPGRGRHGRGAGQRVRRGLGHRGAGAERDRPRARW